MALIASIGIPFIELQQVESTNNYATGLVHAGMAQNGTAVFAHHQTKGKGQRQKEWVAEPGKNIALSIILSPVKLSLPASFLLSMATALAVKNFLLSLVDDEVKIKWPNDVYWRDRKAAGILIENVVQGSHWTAAVAGIGVNINQVNFDALSNKAVSLKQITGKEADPLALAKTLCNFLTEAYQLLEQRPGNIPALYNDALYKKEETVRLKKGTRVFSARVKSVTNFGQLVVQHSAEEYFNVGEIEWLF